MTVIDKPYYYSLNEILTKQRPINFIIGGRELGKTFAVKEYILKKLLDNPEDQMIYLVRYQADKRMLKDLFDDVLKLEKFKDVKYKITTGKGSAIFINGKQRGTILASTEVERAKRITATKYFYVMFDEFLVPQGKRYAPNEVNDVMTIIHTVIRDKGERFKDVKVFFLANSTSLFNPYFVNGGFKPDPTKTFNTYEDTVIQICNRDDYKEREYAKDDIHNFFKRYETYSAMAFGNEFHDNNDILIRKRTKYDVPLYTFKIDGKTLGIWYDDKFKEVLFSFKTEPNVRARFSIDPGEQDNETAYKAWYSTNLLQTLNDARNNNTIWFESAAVKSIATKLLKHLRIY